MSRQIKILHLYPKDMNMYGDQGNVLVLKKRLEWCGYDPVVIDYNIGDKLPKDINIVIGGGGQDSGQQKIQGDLLKIGPELRQLADNGTPMLVICGLYQLFGHFFETSEGSRLQGIGLLDMETFGQDERIAGNIITSSDEFGDIVGYENHSGQTFLGVNAKPMAKVRLGVGNNTKDKHEGARYRNVIGSYIHGPLLPKNPKIADWLIGQAISQPLAQLVSDLPDKKLVELARDATLKVSR